MRTPSLLAFPVATRFLNKYSAHPVNDKDTKYIRLVVELKIIHYQHAKIIQSIYLIYQIIFEIHLILESHYWSPIIIKLNWLFLNFYKHDTNQLISSTHSWDSSYFTVPWSKRLRPFLTRNTQKQVTSNMTGTPQGI